MTVLDEPPRPRWPRRPLLALLMESPGASRLLAVLIVAHLGLTQAGLEGWRCPLLFATQRPCPGCGLSRSILAFARGDLAGALELHAFGPVAGIAIAGVVVSGFLPRRARRSWVLAVGRFEVATGISHVLLLLFLVYWLVRMVSGHGDISALA